MIRIGLTGFGDHEELYGKIKPGERLRTYSRFFDIVEIDSSFYAVQPLKNMTKWVAETPEGFGFIVKAYQGMTGHLRGKKNYFDNDEEMYRAFRESIAPMEEAGKLAMVLFQYPPWFDCTRENVAMLREAKSRMGEVPCALEFRHRSWYSPAYRDKTLAFMREHNWIHTVVDEPQAGEGSIPIVPVATSPDLTYVRLHGRNVQGWTKSSHPDWRKLRYLYNYNHEELEEWSDRLRVLEKGSKYVCVVFNNNSAGDATPNARELKSLLERLDSEEKPMIADAFSEEDMEVPESAK